MCVWVGRGYCCVLIHHYIYIYIYIYKVIVYLFYINEHISEFLLQKYSNYVLIILALIPPTKKKHPKYTGKSRFVEKRNRQWISKSLLFHWSLMMIFFRQITDIFIIDYDRRQTRRKTHGQIKRFFILIIISLSTFADCCVRIERLVASNFFVFIDFHIFYMSNFFL